MESHVGDNDCRIKMMSKPKMYHVNVLKKYIASEPKVDVVQVTRMMQPCIAVAGVIYQNTDQEIGEVLGLDGYYQKEGVRDIKLGEDQRHMLKDLTRRYPDVFTDMPMQRNRCDLAQSEADR